MFGWKPSGYASIHLVNGMRRGRKSGHTLDSPHCEQESGLHMLVIADSQLVAIRRGGYVHLRTAFEVRSGYLFAEWAVVDTHVRSVRLLAHTGPLQQGISRGV